MINLDMPTFTDLLNKVVADHGEEYVDRNYTTEVGCDLTTWNRCFYVTNEAGESRPSCIAAAVLHAAGVPLDTLRAYEGDGVVSVLHIFINTHVLKVDREVVMRLDRAQFLQDHEEPWGSIRDDVLSDTFQESTQFEMRFSSMFPKQ